MKGSDGINTLKNGNLKLTLPAMLMCHSAQIREGNEDDPEVVAASFVGMHMEREGSVVDADLAASTTLLSIEELEEGEMLRVGLGR